MQNKSLTDEDATDDVLSLQCVGWVTRKASKMASVTLSIKQYIGADGVEKIEISQSVSGASSQTEELVLVWKSKWMKLAINI
ncbi:hypothetical protein CPB83DRAFT_896696 [Crepidotus variabilis]|uniref:Uncharacterized protein n=1 Tax=Crepidotus variabilis TaxID=179855 RepID=A0A9P6EB29_9AGAR|nr:hypothetical protein CPB83DRAFT_896696 [Crepidotus variabilis]